MTTNRDLNSILLFSNNFIQYMLYYTPNALYAYYI